MKVTNIDIRDLNWDDRTRCFRGSVSMTMIPGHDGRPRNVNFICQAHRAPDCPSSLITYDFVTHALEQARAMPGFRRGEEQISVDITSAVGRLPLSPRAASA
ncbi:hypothetical protein [Maritimibacter sp. UBA3975]|uniref:hypothetical protein n=1 Tax=Maritimibacter sp. UBA3975 TaxID=1946833 RepID=UPI0025C5A2E6|nr:hypothetical protein [Maritimibacter sp. UBA3975]|tara:strand:+ start:11282 stop:11587 length:306 start_codon:yes stop_codon:yes gene_type:complete